MTGNFQVSSKLPDGRIFVVASETYIGFVEAVEAVIGIEEAQAVFEIMGQSLAGAPTNGVQAVQNVNAAFTGAEVVHTAHPVSSQGNLGPSSKTCSHGVMTKRTGAGAKGPWKAYMCPSPKGTPDQCEPMWIRRHESEWNSF